MRVYSTQLAPADVAAVTQAMYGEAALRGIVTSAPAPVNLATAQFHAVGDSITYGFLSSSPWPSLMHLTNQPNYTITDWGIVGIPVQALNASGGEPGGSAVQVGGWTGCGDGDGGHERFCPDCGSTTVQSVFGNLLGEVTALKTAGCKVFVGTMISRTGKRSAGNKRSMRTRTPMTG